MNTSRFDSPNLTERFVRQLFSLSTIAETRSFLEGIGAQSAGSWKWVPLGGRENNAGSVNLAVESGQALVERITNSLDAHIELQYELLDFPSGIDSPKSAVARLWQLEAGRLSRQSQQMADFIDEMAPRTLVRVIGSSRRRKSSVIVADSGIGQHPRDFPTTLLSLGESNKVDKPHLLGAFGQGGSSTFAYCPYTVVVSRRQLDCLDGKSDLTGWTIVRQYDDDTLKVFRYEYLVDEDGNIPTLDPDYLESIDLDHQPGTRIVHIAYDLGKLNTRWSLVGFRYFDNLLFDPVLPYRIEDHRFDRQFNRNLYGARNRLDQVDISRRPEAQNYDANLEQWDGDGTVNIRYWVFRSSSSAARSEDNIDGVKLDSYLDSDKSPRTIIFTLNGQRHHSQEKRIVRSRRLGALADYLLVHVDCDGISRSLKKQIFTATRAGAASGELREDLLLSAVRDALSDPWLRRKMDEIVRRRQEQATDESATRVRRMLDRLISVYRVDQHAGGRGGQDKGGAGRGGDEERKTRDPPSFLKFADHRLLEVQRGETKTMFLITDGPDDLVSRQRRRARVTVYSDSDEIAAFHVGNIRDGRVAVGVQVPIGTPTGRRQRMIASLEMEPGIHLSDSRDLRVVAPPDPYVGLDPPAVFQFTTNSTLELEVGRRATGRIQTDARNDILDRPVNPGRIKATCDIPSVSVAIRGPRDGTARAEARASGQAVPQTKGMITATLSLPDGSEYVASRPCKIVEARERRPSPGNQDSPIPAYQVIKVWRVAPAVQPEAATWDSFSTPWDDKTIGTWEMNGDELHLFVNMDERQCFAERKRHFRGRFDASYSDRLSDRYVAYLSFHLFQLHEQSQRATSETERNGESRGNQSDSDGLSYDPDSDLVALELHRVAATIIQTLRSEAELMRLEASTVNEDSD